MKRRVLVTALVLVSLACTGGEPEKKGSPKSSGSPAPLPQRSSPPPPPQPTPVADAEPAPVVEQPSGEWWCVCYQSTTDEGPKPTTSCRQLERECRALEKRVEKGGRGIVPSSLTHGCRTVVGEHPGDALGGRDAWQPSKLAGAWTSEGACLLEGVADGPPPSEDPAAEAGGASSFDHRADALGELHLGMPANEVVALLGNPKEKGEIGEEEATGDFVQRWDYSDVGVQLEMRANSQRGAQVVRSIDTKAPCKLQTKRGIMIGSTRVDVVKAYGDVQDKFESDVDDERLFVAGSIYGGVMFTFEGDKVTEIFIGAAAE